MGGEVGERREDIDSSSGLDRHIVSPDLRSSSYNLQSTDSATSTVSLAKGSDCARFSSPTPLALDAPQYHTTVIDGRSGQGASYPFGVPTDGLVMPRHLHSS